METHYLYKCILCEETKIKRCSSCKMIAYCSKEHQTEHRSVHKKFCKIITGILKSENKSHIYENIDSTIWCEEKCRIMADVEKKLQRSLNDLECHLLELPRLCFICREANQEKLKTCTKCFITSFCDNHPTSHIHERFCINGSSEINNESVKKINVHLPAQISSVVAGTKNLKPDDPLPTTMNQFLNSCMKQEKFSPKDKIFLSEVFSLPLTICSTLKTLFNNIPSKLMIHLKSRHCAWTIVNFEFWETILHLLPEVKNVKIVYVDDISDSSAIFKIDLCRDCKSKKKTLQIEKNPISYDQPTLIGIFSSFASAEKELFKKIGYFNDEEKNEKQKLKCPVVITSSAQDLHIMEMKNFSKLFDNFEIIYNGYNDYSSLLRPIPTEIFLRHSQFMTILQPISDNNEEKSRKAISSFYPQICHFCRKQEGKIICNHCKIVSYCDKKHENRDKIHHKDVCEVIHRLRKEMGVGKNLFHQGNKATDPNSWLRRRIEILKNVQMRIGRTLTKFEEEIFLFPKTCGVCHEIDNFSKSCECGVFLCKKHKNDSTHKKICGQLAIYFKASMNPALNQFSLLKESSDESWTKNFIATIFPLLKENSDCGIFNGDLPFAIKMINFPLEDKTPTKKNILLKELLITEFLSAPFTLFHTLEKMNAKIKSSMIIHVIGANYKDFESKFIWAFLFYSVENIDSMKLIFIGTEIVDFSEIPIKCSEMKINLKIEGQAMNYNDYLSGKNFTKPDVILCCNVNIHERKYSIEEKIWKRTILTLAKLEVPFIVTAGTKERAEEDHKIISSFFPDCVNFVLFEENRFASLQPERDFETMGVMYENKYIIAYDWKLQNSSNSMEKKEEMTINDIELKINGSKDDEENTENTEKLIKQEEEIIEKNLENEAKNLHIEKEIISDNEKLLVENNNSDSEGNYPKAEESIPEGEPKKKISDFEETTEREEVIPEAKKIIELEVDVDSPVEKINEEDLEPMKKISDLEERTETEEVNPEAKKIIDSEDDIDSPVGKINEEDLESMKKISDFEQTTERKEVIPEAKKIIELEVDIDSPVEKINEEDLEPKKKISDLEERTETEEVIPEAEKIIELKVGIDSPVEKINEDLEPKKKISDSEKTTETKKLIQEVKEIIESEKMNIPLVNSSIENKESLEKIEKNLETEENETKILIENFDEADVQKLEEMSQEIPEVEVIIIKNQKEELKYFASEESVSKIKETIPKAEDSKSEIENLQNEIKILKEDLNSANILIEKLNKEVSIYQQIYPTFVDKNNLIKEALEYVEKSFTSAFERE